MLGVVFKKIGIFTVGAAILIFTACILPVDHDFSAEHFHESEKEVLIPHPKVVLKYELNNGSTGVIDDDDKTIMVPSGFSITIDIEAFYDDKNVKLDRASTISDLNIFRFDGFQSNDPITGTIPANFSGFPVTYTYSDLGASGDYTIISLKSTFEPSGKNIPCNTAITIRRSQ